MAIVNHTPFSPKVLDTPTSHNSSLELESAVAPAGPLAACFIHRDRPMELFKRLSFSPTTLFFPSNDRVEFDGLPIQQNIRRPEKIHILGMPEEGKDLYLFIYLFIEGQ